MEVKTIDIPIIEIPIQGVRLFVKREDLVHREISGNKYWKMFYNVKNYLAKPGIENRLIITFGGAFSNHIAATAAVGEKFGMKTLGIIRGEELEGNWHDNPTLADASYRGMEFLFVSRDAYRDKENISQSLQKQYPEALIVPEGGTNEWAVKGIQYMLDDRTREFDFLCSAVGTGGTLSGLTKYAENHQKILGFKVVDDTSVDERISQLSGKNNYTLFDAHEGRYGKITEETVAFINEFYDKYEIPLDPIYTGKMMRKLFQLIEENYFPENAKVLAFHTGGVQGILGANELLKKQKKELIKFGFS